MRGSSRGQVIVMFAIALVVLIAMTGLVVDGGYAWAQERHTQNGADAAARAGAIVLARRAADASSQTELQWGEEVRNKVYLTALDNQVDVGQAMYTDWTGAILPGYPVDGQPPPPGAAGVNVAARRIFNTHLVRLVGITSWTIIQEATAIAGPTTGCPETIEGCILLPIAFPVTVLACGQGNTSVPELPTRSWPPGVEVTIPLCGGNPGSVGWIDWSPPQGGTSELEDAILQPTAYYIPLPSWHYITETGDVSAAYIEDALNEYAGDTVLFPLFDSTCSEEPLNNQSSGCPDEFVGGSGVNQWYHISAFLSFRLNYPKGAYVNGSNATECAAANANECIKGSFVDLITEGSVGPPCPPEGCPQGTAFSVQLVK